MKKRLLFLTPVFPLPLSTGQRVRIFNILQGCAADHDTTFVGPGSKSREDCERVEGLCANSSYIQKNATSDISVARKIALGLKAREVLGLDRLDLLLRFEEILQCLDLHSFDRIWIERRDLTILLKGHLERAIVDLDDLEHRKKIRDLSLRASRLQRLKGWPRIAGLYLGEVFDVRRACGTVVCSDEDRRYMLSKGVRNCFVVPNGTDIDPATDGLAQGKGIVFLGNMRYEPNVDAMEHFATDIYPLLARNGLPGHVDVIGAPPEMGGAFPPFIRFLGFVPDLAKGLRAYAVSVVPLRRGGGTKLKVLDAMASGVPLVTTSVGAEGLGIVHGEHALVADDPDGFAKAVSSLLRDPSLALRLASNARRLVGERFTWDRIRADLAAHLRDLPC